MVGSELFDHGVYMHRCLCQLHLFIYSAAAVFFAIALSGCAAGTIYFDGGSSGQVSVEENRQGVVWTSVAQVEGVGSNPKGLTYRLRGPDADFLAINAISGAVSFKEGVDFERPLDSDNDNEYLVDIEASFNNQVAVQKLLIKIVDVSRPEIVLLTPKPNQNLGLGDVDVQVDMLVKVFDSESNTPLLASSVTINTSTLVNDPSDAQLWRGKFTVPQGGVDISLVGSLANNTKVESKTKLFNKSGAINPTYMGVNPGIYLMFLDPERGMLARLNLVTHQWSSYVTYSQLVGFKPIYDFNSGSQHIYAYVDAFSAPLYSFNVASQTPHYYTAGCLRGIVSLTYDLAGNRVLALVKDVVADRDRYRVLSFATDPARGFVNGQPETWGCNAAQEDLVWEVPESVLAGSFKQFNFNRVSKTYIFADERIIDGVAVTVVQGFSEAGVKRFEVKIGPDISNLAVNQAQGMVYVAERHSSAAGKLKAINISTGEVADLVQPCVACYLGGYTDLRMDNVNKRLYIGDDVSDAIFVVDLVNKSMSEILYSPSFIEVAPE